MKTTKLLLVTNDTHHVTSEEFKYIGILEINGKEISRYYFASYHYNPDEKSYDLYDNRGNSTAYIAGITEL